MYLVAWARGMEDFNSCQTHKSVHQFGYQRNAI